MKVVFAKAAYTGRFLPLTVKRMKKETCVDWGKTSLTFFLTETEDSGSKAGCEI
jgi:hypothetical protein